MIGYSCMGSTGNLINFIHSVHSKFYPQLRQERKYDDWGDKKFKGQVLFIHVKGVI